MKFPHHVYVLNLLNTVPASSVHLPFEHAMTCQQACDAWDHLYEYIHANFASPDSAMPNTTGKNGMQEWLKNNPLTDAMKKEIRECGEMLRMNGAELEARLESLPPYFAEYLFPVAVARYLLRELAIPMNHRRTKTFTEFHNRYGVMILEC